MSRKLSSTRCYMCGGMAAKDYEVVAPKGRDVFSLCVECRDASQAKGFAIRAWPPRRGDTREWTAHVARILPGYVPRQFLMTQCDMCLEPTEDAVLASVTFINGTVRTGVHLCLGCVSKGRGHGATVEVVARAQQRVMA